MKPTTLLLALAALAGCASSGSTPASTTATTTTTTASATASASTGGERESFQRMSVDELAGMLSRNETVYVFDNNRRERYVQGHVPTARWVSYDAVNASVLPEDRAARLVFYCANESCRACHHAADAATALGYTNVYILPAGIAGWTSSGQRVVAGEDPS